MKIICQESKNIIRSLGSFERTVSKAEMEKRLKFRRSMVARKDLPAGHVLSAEDVTFKRPGTGIAPDQLENVVGKSLKKAVSVDDLINWEDFA